MQQAEVGSELFVSAIEVCLPVKGSRSSKTSEALLKCKVHGWIGARFIFGHRVQFRGADIMGVRAGHQVLPEARGISEVSNLRAPEDFPCRAGRALRPSFRNYVIERARTHARYGGFESSYRTAFCSMVRRDPGKLTRSDTLVTALHDRLRRRILERSVVRSSIRQQVACERLSSRSEVPPSLRYWKDRTPVAPGARAMSHDHKVEELTEGLR